MNCSICEAPTGLHEADVRGCTVARLRQALVGIRQQLERNDWETGFFDLPQVVLGEVAGHLEDVQELLEVSDD